MADSMAGKHTRTLHSPVARNIFNMLDSGDLAFVLEADGAEAKRLYCNYRGMAQRHNLDVIVKSVGGKVYVINGKALAEALEKTEEEAALPENCILTDEEVKIGNNKRRNCRDVIAFGNSTHKGAVKDMGSEEACQKTFISYRNFVAFHDCDFDVVKQGTKVFFARP